ncbi:MAG: hypothetical protein QM601_06320 [Pseudoxanthomonas sp.]
MATEMEDEVSLPANAVASLRKAVVLGMVAVGEIERLQQLSEWAEMSGKPWPEEQRAIHPAGHELLADFADALYWLEVAAG